MLYADDTLLYYSVRTTDELQNKINADLELLSFWLNNNLLTLNYDKTKFMIFANKKQSMSLPAIDMTIKNKLVSQEKSMKYLGVILTQDLSWQEHTDNMIAKINQRLDVLWRIKEFLDFDTLYSIYIVSTATI